jgi:predicted PurR-regulated permease PerM
MTDSSQKKFIKLILWISGTVILLYVLYQLSDIIIIVALSILLSFIFVPFVNSLESRGFNRLTSTLLTYGIFLFLLYLSLSVIIPKFIVQMDQLITALEGFSFDTEMQAFEKSIIAYLPFLKPGDLTIKIEEFITNQFVNSIESISSVLTSIVSVIAVVVIVPFITFFLLKDSKRILQSILQMMPNKNFEMSYWVLKKVSLKLGMFVRAWIFDAAFVGVMIGTGFFIIGLPNAMPLGVIAGLGHLIPYFGPVIGGVPAIILSLIQYGDFSQLPLIVLIVLGTYTIDNGFVQPYIFGKSVDMHPIVIILLIIFGRTVIWFDWNAACCAGYYCNKNLRKRNLLCNKKL